MENEYIPKLTKDKDLVFASFHAKEEANAWRNTALGILKNDYTNRQACVLQILSSELYLKSLLMILDIDVIKTFKNKDGHSLYKLYNSLPDAELKKTIEENVKFHRLEINTGANIYWIETFDEFLKEISHGFINYRYEYEKYLLDLTINIPIEFIWNLNYILYLICNNLIYQFIDKNGEISSPPKVETICYHENKELFTLHKRKYF